MGKTEELVAALEAAGVPMAKLATDMGGVDYLVSPESPGLLPVLLAHAGGRTALVLEAGRTADEQEKAWLRYMEKQGLDSNNLYRIAALHDYNAALKAHLAALAKLRAYDAAHPTPEAPDA